MSKSMSKSRRMSMSKSKSGIYNLSKSNYR